METMKRSIVKEAPKAIISLIKIVAKFIWKERKHDMLYNRFHQSEKNFKILCPTCWRQQRTVVKLFSVFTQYVFKIE